MPYGHCKNCIFCRAKDNPTIADTTYWIKGDQVIGAAEYIVQENNNDREEELVIYSQWQKEKAREEAELAPLKELRTKEREAIKKTIEYQIGGYSERNRLTQKAQVAYLRRCKSVFKAPPEPKVREQLDVFDVVTKYIFPICTRRQVTKKIHYGDNDPIIVFPSISGYDVINRVTGCGEFEQIKENEE